MSNEKLYAGLAKLINDTRPNYLISIAVPIGVAFIGLFGILASSIITAHNLNKQLKVQVDEQVNKIKLEYEYNQKRDNFNFINKVLIDKISALYSVTITLYDPRFFSHFRSEMVKCATFEGHKIDKSQFPKQISYDESNRKLQEVHQLLAFFPEYDKDFEDMWTKILLRGSRYEMNMMFYDAGRLRKNNIDSFLEADDVAYKLFYEFTNKLLRKMSQIIKAYQQ